MAMYSFQSVLEALLGDEPEAKLKEVNNELTINNGPPSRPTTRIQRTLWSK